MKQTTPMKKGLPGRGTRLSKILLAALFALGLCLILAGIQGLETYSHSGFSSESAYGAIHALAGQTEADWRELHQPFLAELPQEERGALGALAGRLLAQAWEEEKPGASGELEALLASHASRREELTLRLLCLYDLTDGPRIGAGTRKALLAETAENPQETRLRLLRCALDGSLPLSPAAEKAAGDLEGAEREAMLLQAFFTSWQEESRVDSEQVSELKRAVVDDKSAILAADRMIVLGEVHWLWMVILSGGRTIILLGILLALDAALLFLLMRSERNWAFDVKWILILLIVNFLLVFQLFPMIYMLVRAVCPDGSPSLETFRRLFMDQDGLNQTAIANTFLAALATMVLGTLVAFPLAFLVGRTNLYGRKVFRFLFVLTYMVPPYVGAMAWLRLANPNVGTVNLWLRDLFALGDGPGPLNVYSLPGLIWVLTTFYYPYSFITISRAMEKMDPSLEEASRVAGASPLKTLMTVTLPMTLPSLISGALLVFVSAASCYGIPSIIGSPGRVHTITTRIVEYVALGQDRLTDATGMAVLLMTSSLLLLFLSDRITARRQYITVSGKSVRPALVDLRRWRIPLTVLVSLFAVVVIVIPFATILTTSFKVDVGKSLLAQGNFTWTNWETIFGRTETLGCLKNSLIYGAVTATVGILVACTMSYLLQRTQVRGRQIPNFLITLGSGTPSVVIALGLIMTMKGNYGINIYNTAYILIIAYLVKYMMMGMRTVVSAMSQIHVSLEECSQVAGASWLRTMRRITAPLIFPSIAAGWFLIFIPSFYELSMTTLLYSNSTKTIGFQLYEYWTYTSQPMSCAMAFGILLIVIALNFILNRLTRGEFSL